MKDLKFKLKTLIKEDKAKDIENLLIQKNVESIFKVIKQSIINQEGSMLLTSILSSLTCSTRESTTLKLELYQKVLEFIKHERESREHGEAVAVLMIQAENFPPYCLVELIDFYLDQIKLETPFAGRWTELLGKLLCLSSICPKVTYEGNELLGNDYFHTIIKKTCNFKWCTLTATTMLTIFKELNLPKDDLKDILFKAQEVLNEVDYLSVPPIIYNCILLGQGKCPGKVLEITIDYFNQQEKILISNHNKKESSSLTLTDISEESETIEGAGSYGDLIEAQSTVILHIIHLAQYDPQLVQDFMKMIKSSTWLPRRIFTPINLALSLSLAFIDRYKVTIIDALKSCILKFYRHEEKIQKCHWMREVFKEKLNLSQQIQVTIKNCKGGWDQVSQGLVYLSFSLLESGGGIKGDIYPVQMALNLVSSILPAVIKKEPELATSVLNQLSNYILTASSATQYIDLLSKLVKTIPHTLLDNVSVLRELLEQLGFMPLSVAAPLLHSLLPLFKMSMTLKDALMLILRKMLFSKQIESRQAAVEGFLQFLRHFKVMGTLPASQGSVSFSSALSQVSVDVHNSIDSNTNEALCLELLGVLRRCLSQQHQVKSRLYYGLQNVLKSNPKIALNVMSLLHQHLVQYVDTNSTALNPIVLKKLVTIQTEVVTLVEPIGELLSSLLHCKRFCESQRDSAPEEDLDEDEDTLEVMNDVSSVIDILKDKLAYCDMDDLEFGTASFSSSSVIGKQNLLYAQQMVAVIDALMESQFYCGALESMDKMNILIALFKTQNKIIDLVNDRSKSKKGEKLKDRPGTSKSASNGPVTFSSVVSLKFATLILDVAIKDTHENLDCSCVEFVQNNYNLQLYLLNVVEQIVGNLKTMLPTDRDRLLPYLKSVGHLLFRYCFQNLANIQDDQEDERLQRNSKHSLLVLTNLISSCVKFFKSRLDSIFMEIAGKSGSTSGDRILYTIQKKLQTILVRILQLDDSSPWSKQAALLFQTMVIITQRMDPLSSELLEVHQWALQICKDHSFDTPSLSQAIVHLMLTTGDKVKQSIGSVTRLIGKELHSKLGDIDQDVSTEVTDTYKVVTEASAHAVLSAILSYTDDTFIMIEMTLNIFRASLNAGLGDEENSFEKCVSGCLAIIIHTMHEILQSSLPQGSCLDEVTKTTRKLYVTLTLYVRYYLDYFRIRSGAQISGSFEKLVHLSGMMLKSNVYILIKYINSRETRKRSQSLLTARATKESKLIPDLVFAMEEYEKLLIALTKKSNVNLMMNMTTSTSRDFRIVAKEVQKEDDVASVDSNQEESEEEEETMPPPKRTKT